MLELPHRSAAGTLVLQKLKALTLGQESATRLAGYAAFAEGADISMI